ncbi:BnaA06g24460D [Brassica napus]|uniref:BnaA06g24460D protein n=1 Tax=Brassica napus TaxID=3708 RepID=A0A078FAE4_BRANA|nr:BnaA06g24460D [Brassica napus]
MRRDHYGGLIVVSRISSFFGSKAGNFRSQFRLLCIASNSFTTTHTFSPLLRQCIDERWLPGIKTIQSQMLKSGFPVQLSGSKLVDAGLKCGEIGYAREVFDEMTERHIVTWTSLISDSWDSD